MDAVCELSEMGPRLEYIERSFGERGNGRSNSTVSGHTSSPVAHVEQAPLIEDFGPEVDAFLTRYPFLVSLLKESADPLRKIFGDQTLLSLMVETDPEVEDWEYLVIAFWTTLPTDQAQAQLDAFGAAWWLDALPRAQGKVLFTLEFV